MLGWGYCSSAPDQEDCNEEITDVTDVGASQVNILRKDFCIEKLMKNLKVEQPGTIIRMSKQFLKNI